MDLTVRVTLNGDLTHIASAGSDTAKNLLSARVGDTVRVFDSCGALGSVHPQADLPSVGGRMVHRTIDIVRGVALIELVNAEYDYAGKR